MPAVCSLTYYSKSVEFVIPRFPNDAGLVIWIMPHSLELLVDGIIL